MPIERYITQKLVNWKNDNNRKPLVIKGENQVGKTYTIMEFGKKNYSEIAYFNFSKDKKLNVIFETMKSIEELLENLSIAYGKRIIPDKTLIFFDEIQECAKAFETLKYFKGKASKYHVIVTGNLVKINLLQKTLPTENVQFLNMYPLSFNEFLIADNTENMVAYKKSIKEIEEKFQQYFIMN